jgi:4-carboxymuconolactone decarboxylase
MSQSAASNSSLGRFLPLLPEALSDDQARVRQMLTQGARGAVPKPYEIWISSPALAERLEKLGLYLLKESALTSRENEIAILVAVRHWGASYALHAHRRIGATVGLSNDVVDAICGDGDPALEDPRERVVYEVATIVHRGGSPNHDLFRRAHEALGDRGLCDLMALLGYYAAVAFTLNLYEVPAPTSTR